MKERLFTCKSLERVCRVVDWEEQLEIYRDGTTNQQRYMMALAELWEGWMRDWTLPDLQQALLDASSDKFVEAFQRLIETIPQRISQLVGFWDGLWYGANPYWKSVALLGNRSRMVYSDAASLVRDGMERVLRRTAEVLSPFTFIE